MEKDLFYQIVIIPSLIIEPIVYLSKKHNIAYFKLLFIPSLFYFLFVMQRILLFNAGYKKNKRDGAVNKSRVPDVTKLKISTDNL